MTAAPRPRPGRDRYAAAMTLYQQGSLSPAALEIYRICSLLDRDDPAPLLAEAHQPADIPARIAAELAIRDLLTEIDRSLATLSGPGVAEVRTGLNHWRYGPATPRPAPHPVVTQHLPAALQTVTTPLGSAIAAAAPYLGWLTYDAYDPARIGTDFTRNHAYASLIGPDATIAAEDFDLGLFLIAPHILYRDHHHAAPELYLPLTGPHGWRFGPDKPLTLLPAHIPIWNPPHQPHLTKVGPIPYLCIFAWTGAIAAAAAVVPATDWPALEGLRLTATGAVDD
ncbi:MAG: dimethylsulfonioproprionate lyase family protein [bacterium]